MAAPTHAISHEVSSLTSAAPVTLVFGLQEATVAWLVHHLREAGVAAVLADLHPAGGTFDDHAQVAGAAQGVGRGGGAAGEGESGQEGGEDHEQAGACHMGILPLKAGC